jgi:hypothetical protein
MVETGSVVVLIVSSEFAHNLIQCEVSVKLKRHRINNTLLLHSVLKRQRTALFAVAHSVMCSCKASVSQHKFTINSQTCSLTQEFV